MTWARFSTFFLAPVYAGEGESSEQARNSSPPAISPGLLLTGILAGLC